ncbi:hypothetical protein AZE42_05695 [Rhizopogon vesiculosus]|uniref:Uncharacterized protein n=1 Tax=Rhizopogon vesiculosus TaxID=180088 RepID=A0A1J8QCF4_9AGAM|nr:hypothetical protein AZE42_05695 [Rhizopogon vesiculosus]
MELPPNPGPTISRHQHSPRPVLVAAALFVARRPEPVSEQVKHIKELPWWSRCILFICCVPTACVGTVGVQGSGAVQDSSGQA